MSSAKRRGYKNSGKSGIAIRTPAWKSHNGKRQKLQIATYGIEDFESVTGKGITGSLLIDGKKLRLLSETAN